ncbi:protein-tyrosine phosphatase-like protein, partial [Syncephalis pseudoplumigaleata]
EWTYDQRRTMQLLLPGLYLGSFWTSRSLATLREHHITHVLHACDTNGRPLPTSLAATHQAIELKILDIYDRGRHSFAAFVEAVQFCRDAWAQHGTVLVYCLTGIDASAVIATAIVMNMTGMSHTDAMHWVKMRRRCADIRGAYLRLLQVGQRGWSP